MYRIYKNFRDCFFIYPHFSKKIFWKIFVQKYFRKINYKNLNNTYNMNETSNNNNPMVIINWIRTKDKLPELDRPVLAFFPELSGRGLPLEITMRETGSNADRYKKLTGMEGQGLLAHYYEATEWIYLDDIKMPKQIKSKYLNIKQITGGSVDYDDYFPTTADPFGFEEGY